MSHMNLNALQLIGVIMIIFAFGAQAFIPGTIVYYSTTPPGAVFNPGGTTPNSPLTIPPSSVYRCIAMLTGLQTGEIANATIQISLWSGSSWNTVGTFPLQYTSTVVGTLWYTYDFTTGSSGNLYALSYLVQTVDVGSFTGIGYIKTQANLGYFAINGIYVTIANTLRVSNPLLSITYTINATGTISYSTLGISVKVFNGSTLLNQFNLSPPAGWTGSVPANFTGSYTLPGTGSYRLDGFVTYNTVVTQEMSILMPWGTASDTSSQMSFSDFYLVIGLFGIVFVIVGARRKKNES